MQQQDQVRRERKAGQKPRVLLIGPLYPAEVGVVGFQRQAVAALSAHADVSVVDVQQGGQALPSPMFVGTHLGTLDLGRPRSWRRVNETLAAHAFDVVCVTVWTPRALPAYRAVIRAMRRRGIRTATLVHSYVPRRMRLLAQVATRALIHMTDDVVAIEGVAEWLVPKDANWVLHPVYSHYGDALDREEACQRLGLDPQQRHLLFFGYGRSHKGLDMLLHAVAGLDERVVLLVVGKQLQRSPRLDAAFRLVQNLVSAGYIHVVDEVVPEEDVSLYFSAADAVVMPYRRSESAGPGMVAVHYGLPVVVSNFPALTYLATFHPASRVAYPGDVASLIEAIRQCMRAIDAQQEEKPHLPFYTWDDFAHDFLASVHLATEEVNPLPKDALPKDADLAPVPPEPSHT